MSPRREHYVPHVSLTKLESTRLPLSRSFLSFDFDVDSPSTTSEYRLCFANHHPKRPYVFHAQPSHVFDYVLKPLDRKSIARSSSSSSVLKDTEYQERYLNNPFFNSLQELLPSYLSTTLEMQSARKQKKERMARSQYFHHLIADNEKLIGGKRHVGTSEHRTAFRWPYDLSPSEQNAQQQQRDLPTPTYSPYYVPRDIYEPLPTAKRTVVKELK